MFVSKSIALSEWFSDFGMIPFVDIIIGTIIVLFWCHICLVLVQELVNPPSNGLPVRLEIRRIHSTFSAKTMTWQASTLHVIGHFIFKVLKNVKITFFL